MLTARTTALAAALEKLYRDRSADIPFHGWHHVHFVAKKAVEFARELDVDGELVEAAALTHDLNYLVVTNSAPEVGRDLRISHLERAGFSADEVEDVDSVVMQQDMARRTADISDAAKALSDADTLFKALPVTPIVLANHYLIENGIEIGELASRVVTQQRPLLEQGIYFYTDSARSKYLNWAHTNVELWENVRSALGDEDVKEMLEIARRMGVIHGGSVAVIDASAADNGPTPGDRGL
ncbi:hypothetical protein ACFFGH_27805 [Lysobacter korlensis]|uniref:HD domain-containing protein n=1 Tax=Lysobacter korlensis TaxID=553636 RepID=A0ABV6S0I7_9GAMM